MFPFLYRTFVYCYWYEVKCVKKYSKREISIYNILWNFNICGAWQKNHNSFENLLSLNLADVFWILSPKFCRSFHFEVQTGTVLEHCKNDLTFSLNFEILVVVFSPTPIKRRWSLRWKPYDIFYLGRTATHESEPYLLHGMARNMGFTLFNGILANLPQSGDTQFSRLSRPSRKLLIYFMSYIFI